MNEPISFESASPRFAIPFLFPAQAQKEFYINEAHAIIDSLLHPVIEGIAQSPPLDPKSGSCWLVAPDPIGEWSQHVGQIACFQSGSWLFAKPSAGMRVFDRSSGADLRYLQEWHGPSSVEAPTGGDTIDSEARAAVSELIQALRTLGIVL